MVYDRKLQTLVPFDFEQILDRIPELSRLRFAITVLVLDELLDSSNMVPDNWLEISTIIEKNYDKYDSFVVLHGTDTMAYTASALSFLLEDLRKPVILTGAQLPIGAARCSFHFPSATHVPLRYDRNIVSLYVRSGETSAQT